MHFTPSYIANGKTTDGRDNASIMDYQMSEISGNANRAGKNDF